MVSIEVGKNRARAFGGVMRPSNDRPFIIYVKDESKRYTDRVMEVRKANPKSTILVISYDESLITKAECISRIEKATGNAEVLMLSSIVPPARVVTPRGKIGPRSSYYTMVHRWQAPKDWQKHPVDISTIKDKTCYVVLDGSKSLSGTTDRQVNKWFEYATFCESAGIKVAPMIFVNSSQETKVKANSNLISVTDYLDELHKELSANTKLIAMMKRKAMLDALESEMPYEMRNGSLRDMLMITTFGQDRVSRMLKIQETLRANLTNQQMNIDANFLLRNSISINIVALKQRYKEKVQSIMYKYPLLAVYFSSSRSNQSNGLHHLCLYVKAVHEGKLG